MSTSRSFDIELSTGRTAHVEASWVPECGDGWNEPRERAHPEIEDATPNDLTEDELDEIEQHLQSLAADDYLDYEPDPFD